MYMHACVVLDQMLWRSTSVLQTMFEICGQRYNRPDLFGLELFCQEVSCKCTMYSMHSGQNVCSCTVYLYVD